MKFGKDTRPIWVADAETDPFQHGIVPEPFIWGVYHGYDDTLYKEFTGTGPAFTCTYDDLAELVGFLREQEVILYAHNGGKFDWHFLSEFYEAGDELLIINGRLAKFTIGACEFRDSFNLMPVSLEQYNKMKFDYTLMHKAFRGDHMPEIRDYLKSDCVNLWNMVHGFDETYGRHITQASAAMHYWQRTLKNKVPRSGPTFYERFRDYYYGGRVQCFEQGDFKLDAHSVDINSAYPFAMLSQHPYSLEYEEREGKPRNMENWGPMLFTVECVARGCFPYRTINDSLYFPEDDTRRIYNVTGWELLAAIDTDTIEDIKFLTHVKFEETRDFSEYVMHFWEMRKQFKDEGDDGGSFYCKIFLNALYGKFALDPRKHKNYELRHPSEEYDVIENMGMHDSYKHFREWLIVETERTGFGRGQFYNLATAASITGFVRAMLWRAICAADRPLYCDTDSITAVGFNDALKISKALGDWDIEYHYDRVIVAGKKLYAFHIKGKPEKNSKAWKIASKGAKLDYKDLIVIADGGRVHFKNDAPTFSTSKKEPTFVEREIIKTARDIRIVPRAIDPMFVEDE